MATDKSGVFESVSSPWRSPVPTSTFAKDYAYQGLFSHLEKLILSTVSICRLKGSLECQTGGLVTVTEELKRLLQFSFSEIARLQREFQSKNDDLVEEIGFLKGRIESLEGERKDGGSNVRAKDSSNVIGDMAKNSDKDEEDVTDRNKPADGESAAPDQEQCTAASPLLPEQSVTLVEKPEITPVGDDDDSCEEEKTVVIPEKDAMLTSGETEHDSERSDVSTADVVGMDNDKGNVDIAKDEQICDEHASVPVREAADCSASDSQSRSVDEESLKAHEENVDVKKRKDHNSLTEETATPQTQQPGDVLSSKELVDLSFMISINQQITDFVSSAKQAELELNSMTETQRRDTYKLANLYKLRTRIRKVDKKLANILLVKVKETSMPKAGRVDSLLSKLTAEKDKVPATGVRSRRKRTGDNSKGYLQNTEVSFGRREPSKRARR